MLFCLHLKTGRYLVPTGRPRDKFEQGSIPDSTPQVSSLKWWSGRELHPGLLCLLIVSQRTQNYLSMESLSCQILLVDFFQIIDKIVCMTVKMRKFTILDGGESKEVEAVSYKKAVKSYQGSSKSKQVTVEWEAKKGGFYSKVQNLPLGRKKKIGR